LRALLSHDRKLLPVKITDKTKAGGHRTKNIVVKGFTRCETCSDRYGVKAPPLT